MGKHKPDLQWDHHRTLTLPADLFQHLLDSLGSSSCRVSWNKFGFSCFICAFLNSLLCVLFVGTNVLFWWMCSQEKSNVNHSYAAESEDADRSKPGRQEGRGLSLSGGMLSAGRHTSSCSHVSRRRSPDGVRNTDLLRGHERIQSHQVHFILLLLRLLGESPLGNGWNLTPSDQSGGAGFPLTHMGHCKRVFQQKVLRF